MAVDLAGAYNNLATRFQFFVGVVRGIFGLQSASLDWADRLYAPVKSLSPVFVVTLPKPLIRQNNLPKSPIYAMFAALMP